MTWFVIVGSIFCAWAFLSVLGAERASQVAVLKAKIRSEPAAAPKPAPNAPAIKTPSPPAKPPILPAKPAAALPPKKAEKSKR